MKIYQSSIVSFSTSFALIDFVEIFSNTNAQDQAMKLSNVHLSIIFVLIIDDRDLIYLHSRIEIVFEHNDH